MGQWYINSGQLSGVIITPITQEKDYKGRTYHKLIVNSGSNAEDDYLYEYEFKIIDGEVLNLAKAIFRELVKYQHTINCVITYKLHSELEDNDTKTEKIINECKIVTSIVPDWNLEDLDYGEE